MTFWKPYVSHNTPLLSIKDLAVATFTTAGLADDNPLYKMKVKSSASFFLGAAWSS